MTIRNVSELATDKIQIDLTGPDGNAFHLLGQAKRLCRELNKDYDTVRARMIESDYANLIKVFDKEFGDYIDLFTNE